jgi:peroxiredoxin
MIRPARAILAGITALAVWSMWAPAPAQEPTATTTAASEPANSETALILQIDELMTADPTINDPANRQRALLDGLRKVPALVEQVGKLYPKGKYRLLTVSLGVDAYLLRRNLGEAVPDEPIVAGAKQLTASSEEKYRAKGEFVLLELEIPASALTTAPTTSTSRPTAELSDRFIKLAEKYPENTYAPAALYYAATLHLDAGREDRAVAIYDRLVKDYPADALALRSLMLLVQLHGNAGRGDLALAAKKLCLEHFPDSPAAVKYKADIAQSTCVGKPFFLRFQCLQGKPVDVTNHRGKTVLVFFFMTAAGEDNADLAKQFADLADLAAKRGAVLLAVGADSAEDADKVTKFLTANKIAVPILLDEKIEVAQRYGVLMVPAVALVAPDGTLRQIVASARIAADTDKALSTLATQPTTTSAPTK